MFCVVAWKLILRQFSGCSSQLNGLNLLLTKRLEIVELVCFQETDRADSGRLRLETYFEDFLEVGMMLVNSGLVNEVCYCGMLF